MVRTRKNSASRDCLHQTGAAQRLKLNDSAGSSYASLFDLPASQCSEFRKAAGDWMIFNRWAVLRLEVFTQIFAFARAPVTPMSDSSSPFPACRELIWHDELLGGDLVIIVTIPLGNHEGDAQVEDFRQAGGKPSCFCLRRLSLISHLTPSAQAQMQIEENFLPVVLIGVPMPTQRAVKGTESLHWQPATALQRYGAAMH